MVQPSARRKASLAMSLISTSLYASSLWDTNQAFSANLQASRINILLYLIHNSLTLLRFSIETGCPPPVLFVIVINTNGTLSLSGPSNNSSSFSKSILPLNGAGERRSKPSSHNKSIGCD